MSDKALNVALALTALVLLFGVGVLAWSVVTIVQAIGLRRLTSA